MKIYIQISVLFVLLVPPLQANQDGIIVRLAPVHSEASSASPKVGQFAAGTRVSLFGRKGGWKEVFSSSKSLVGWVRSYQVREGVVTEQAQVQTPEEDSRGFLSGLASFSRKASRFFSSGSSSTSSGTATIGVRGLSEGEIKSAKPDLDELAKMQKYASNRARIDQFVLNGQLDANKVKHIKIKKNKKKKKNSSSNIEK